MATSLSQTEKEILTLLDDTLVETAVADIRSVVDYPESVIVDLIQKFERGEYIQRVPLPHGDEQKEWYFHTGKVTLDMRDDDVYDKREMMHNLTRDVTYPIEEENIEDRCAVLKVGKKWREGKYLKYVGFVLKIPKEIREYENVKFAVLSVAHGKAFETYDLWLHAHASQNVDLGEQYDVTPTSDCYIDAGGDVETKLTVSKEVLQAWTKLSRRDIDSALERVHVGYTYNLIACLPRTITVMKNRVQIHRAYNETVDGMNVCNSLLQDKFPMDKM